MRILALVLFEVSLVGCRGTDVTPLSVPDDGSTPIVLHDFTVKQGESARVAFVLGHTETWDSSATHYFIARVESADDGVVTATPTSDSVQCPLAYCARPLGVWEVRGLAVGDTFLQVTKQEGGGDSEVLVHVVP